MVSNIEEQFFKTFDIPKLFSMDINIGDLDANWITVTEPTLKKLWDNHGWDIGNEAAYIDPDEETEEIPTTFKEFKKSNYWREEYPEITDTILIKLVKFLLDCEISINYTDFTSNSSFEEFKEDLLKMVIFWCHEYQHRERKIKEIVLEN